MVVVAHAAAEAGYLVQEAQDEGAHLLAGVLLQDLRPLRVPGGRQHLLQSPELPLKLLQLLLQVDVLLTCRPVTCRRVRRERGRGFTRGASSLISRSL